MGDKVKPGVQPCEQGEGDFESDVDMKDGKNWEVQVREKLNEDDGVNETHITYKSMDENRNSTIPPRLGKKYDAIDWSK